MSAFKSALGRYSNANTAGRRWLYIPYDQLTDEFGPLSREPASELGIVLVENPEKAARRPYHRQKLAFVLASMRHFAIEQAARGVAVRHIVAKPGLGYTGTLDAVVAELGPLRMMRAAERELRSEIAPLVEQRKIHVLPHEGWLSNSEDFASSASRGGVHRMDAFYRRVRKRTGILMTSEGKFEGGRLSFDSENRQAWRGTPRAPALPTYEIDPITAEVVTLVEQRFARHPGVLRPELIAASKANVEHAWEWAKRECLSSFGPFEDAMSVHERTLFHTRISPLINLSRLSARRVVSDVLAMQLPLGSKEGFVRQVVGWREYMHHVHEKTDYVAG